MGFFSHRRNTCQQFYMNLCRWQITTQQYIDEDRNRVRKPVKGGDTPNQPGQEKRNLTHKTELQPTSGKTSHISQRGLVFDCSNCKTFSFGYVPLFKESQNSLPFTYISFMHFAVFS